MIAYQPIIFQDINGLSVKSVVQQVDGAVGPSMVLQRHLEDLHKAIAAVASKLCSVYVDLEGISALVEGRLIVLDK